MVLSGADNAKTPAGKFFPPRLCSGLHLPRGRLLRYVRDRNGATRKAVLIEAQAGQGKSVFAAQILADFGADFCWYQLGVEDGDPLQLVSSLLSGLAERLPGFRAPLLERMLGARAASAQDHARLCSLLLSDLKSFLDRDFYLVLDDVYLLDGYPGSLALIRGLLEGAPPRLRFILTSRHPIAPVVRALLPANDSLIVDNAVLAFNRQEIAELFSGILHIPLSQDSVQLLHRLTEGWTLGLILAGQALPESSGGTFGSELLAMSRSGVLDYFLAQVFPRLSEGLQRSLMILSLLESMPVGLTEMLAEVSDPRELLPGLHRQNFFVRPLDDSRSEYAFHHLFHDTLRSLARQRLTGDETREVHRRAAAWYLRHGRTVEALGHYFAAEEFDAAENLLKDIGLELQANNRLITLHQTLSRVPEEVVRRYGWLSYFAGVATLEIDPPAALSHFEMARQRFLLDGQELGELLTLVSLISYHVMVDGLLHLGSRHIERAASLFERQGKELPPVHQAHAANIFLMAFSNILNDFSGGTAYYDLGLRTARQLQMKNLEAEARVWRCYWHMFSGDVEGSFAEIEKGWPLLHSPLVTPSVKGALYLAAINLLANTGDHAAYRYHHERFRSLMGGDVFDRSVIAAFSNQWAIDLALVRGDFQECRERLGQARTADYAGAGLHLRCQTMQYAALTAALTGNRAEALSDAAESLRLRGEVGSPIFIANNCGLVGGAYVHLGEAGKALPILQQGLEHSRVIGDFYARATLHAYRAWLYLEEGESALARQDLSDLLDCLHRYGHGHFYGWHPQLMQRLLPAAVREGIRVDFARQLAARRLDLAILPGGVTIPLLRIRTLGDLEISIGERPLLRGSDLTPAQRQLLAILLASSGLQRSQEEVAAFLWPDSPGEKARKSFDALLIRLRRTVHEVSGGEIDSRLYLPLRKGVLALEHCRSDAQEFREGASKALRHLRKGENWQADNAFRAAFGLWKGEFLAGMPLPEPAETFRQDLIALYLEGACRWSGLLSSDGRHEEARHAAEPALRHDPIHDDLVRILYQIHTALGKPAKARKVMEDYAAALRAEQFAEDEIEEILEAFWTRPA